MQGLAWNLALARVIAVLVAASQARRGGKAPGFRQRDTRRVDGLSLIHI